MKKYVKDALSVAKSRCFYSDKAHKLIDCNNFKSLTYKEKHKFLRMKGLCFKCYNNNHLGRYGKSSCNGTFHNILLHKNTDSEVTCSVQLNKSPGNFQYVFLNAIPVRVCCEGKETEVHAFLDQGFTACICDRS